MLNITLPLGEHPEYLIGAVSGTFPMDPQMAALFLLLVICVAIFVILLTITLRLYNKSQQKQPNDEESALQYRDTDTFSQAETLIGDSEMELSLVDLGSDREIMFLGSSSVEGEKEEDTRDSLDMLDLYILDDNFDAEAELVDNFGVAFSPILW